MKSCCQLMRLSLRQLSSLAFALFFLLSANLQAKPLTTEEWQTANGTTVIFYQAMEVPMLDLSLAFAAGSAYDGKKFGLSTLTTNMMNQGSLGMDASQIAEKLAETGAQFSAGTSRNMVTLSLRTLTKSDAMKNAVDTYAAIINKPDFPEDAFNREKHQQLLSIAQTQESPESVANLILFQQLYQDHPYAHSVNGKKETVSVLTPKDLREFYQQYFVGANAILVMVGAIDSKQAHQLADQITAGLPKGQHAAAIPTASPLTQNKKIAVDFPSSQTVLRLAQIGIDHHNPNYFPLTVGNYILGGGALTSLLSNEVREKRGLTYGVTSQFMPMPGDGPFLISLSTQNKNADTALAITEQTLAAYLQNGPTDAELKAAKQYLTGSFPISLASNSSIASTLLRIAFYHLPKDYIDTYVKNINKVTAAEIKEAFQKQIHPETMLIIAVGKR